MSDAQPAAPDSDGLCQLGAKLGTIAIICCVGETFSLLSGVMMGTVSSSDYGCYQS